VTLGYTVVEEERGILRVVDPLSLQAQLETRSYQIRYLRPKHIYAPVIASEFVIGEAKGATGKVEDDFPLIEALRRALTPNVGELDYMSDQNVLIVRDTVQVQSEVQDIIERLDVEPAQVFVDVKFVTTGNTDLLDLGFDFGDSGPTIGISGSQIPITIPFNLSGGGFEDDIIANPLEKGPFADPDLNLGNTVAPDTIFGALNFTGVAATLKMLQRDVNSQVVQAPKILALDGRPSTIFVGETIRYAEAKTEQGQAGGLSLSVTEATGSPVEVGFQLLVVPHIIPGTNKLTMEVIPKETSLSGEGDSELAPPGFDVFTIGASGLEGSIALPRKRSSTIVTSMLLDSGQTAVIGGLTTDTDIETVTKVPYLNAIPLIGDMLFSHTERTAGRRSMMVFLTPTIVRSSEETDRLLRNELERRQEDYGRTFEEILWGEDGMYRYESDFVEEEIAAPEAE
jgi:general secretion pathway protein D